MTCKLCMQMWLPLYTVNIAASPPFTSVYTQLRQLAVSSNFIFTTQTWDRCWSSQQVVSKQQRFQKAFEYSSNIFTLWTHLPHSCFTRAALFGCAKLVSIFFSVFTLNFRAVFRVSWGHAKMSACVLDIAFLPRELLSESRLFPMTV